MSARVIGARHLVGRRSTARRDAAMSGQLPLVERHVIALPADLGRALARPNGRAGGRSSPCMLAWTKSTIRRHAATCSRLVHAGAAGRDPPVGRDAGHLGEDQPGAALRAGAVMDEVEVVRRAVRRPNTSPSARRRRGSPAPSRAAGTARTSAARLVDRAAVARFQEPALDAFEPVAVAQAQILVADALRAGQQRISELDRLEMEIAVERLEPFGRVARAVLELEHLEVALGLIFGERLDRGRGPGG